MSFFDGRIGATTGPTTGISSSKQSAVVNFIPSETATGPAPIVSVFPAGQGLNTVNSALPASAAYQPATYGSSSGGLSTTALLLLAAAGAAAWYFLRR